MTTTNIYCPPSLSTLLSLPPPTRTQILQEALSSYPSFISPKLQRLDTTRYETLPKLLQTQDHLTKEDLLHLVDWKLSHGKFRPALRSLVASNSPETILETTKRAFLALKQHNSGNGGSSLKPALDILTTLRGIGPATASLVLSCRDPEGVVFFGDEVAGWVLEDWERKWKYSVKELLELQMKVEGCKGELGLSAVEVERVGFVFGRRWMGEGGEQNGKRRPLPAKRKVKDAGIEGAKTEEERSKGRSGDSEKDGEGEEKETKKKQREEQDQDQVKKQPKKKPKLEISPPPTTRTGTRRSTRSTTSKKEKAGENENK